MPLEIFSGPRCRFTIDDTVVAVGTDATAEQEWQYEGVDPLNSVETIQHDPVGYRCSMRASRLLLVDVSLEQLGFAPLKGQTPQDHLKNILSLPTLVGQIEDDITNIVVARVFGLRLTTDNFSVNSRRLVPQELAFVATRVKGSAENP